MSITITQICNAIGNTLGAATGITYKQILGSLTEGISDWPLLQVYWNELSQDPTTENDRTTFKAAVRQTSLTILADLYSGQRHDIGEDLSVLTPLVDAIQNVLEQQDTKPYFGLDGIRAFSWNARRATFDYGNVKYTGARFTITVRVF